jgi:hypothetical protein
MTKDEALKLALEALKQIDEAMPFPVAKLAQAAIKEALAQQKHCQCPECQVLPHASDCAVHSGPAYPAGGCDCGAQPEQEPVAWANLDALSEQINSVNCGTVYRLPSEAEGREPLYTTPPQRTWVGLTDEEQTQVAWSCGAMSADWLEFARAIEAKLKEKNCITAATLGEKK